MAAGPRSRRQRTGGGERRGVWSRVGPGLPASLVARRSSCSPPAGQGRLGRAMESYDIIANQPVVIDNVRPGSGGRAVTCRGVAGGGVWWPPPVGPGVGLRSTSLGVQDVRDSWTQPGGPWCSRPVDVSVWGGSTGQVSTPLLGGQLWSPDGGRLTFDLLHIAGFITWRAWCSLQHFPRGCTQKQTLHVDFLQPPPGGFFAALTNPLL